jgi:hypothetical protein
MLPQNTSSQQQISFSPEQMRDCAWKITTSAESISQEAMRAWNQTLEELSAAPAPIQALINDVLGQLQKDLTFFLQEESLLGTNLTRVAEIVQQADSGTAQGFTTQTQPTQTQTVQAQ